MVLVAAIILSLAFWSPAFMFIVAAAVVVAIWEMHQGLLARGIDIPQEPLMLGGVVMVGVAFLFGAPALVTATAVTSLVTMLWLLRRGVAGYVQNATASVFTLIYIPFLGSFVALLLAEDMGAKAVITFIGATIASDIGGYAAGVLFGKHPMAPVISPKKSWEGFAGIRRRLRGDGLPARRTPARRRLVGRRDPRRDRRGDGHPRRPVRVGDEA